MYTGEQRDALEALIETTSLADTVEALAYLCELRGERVPESWGDETTVEQDTVASKLLEEVAERLRSYVLIVASRFDSKTRLI